MNFLDVMFLFVWGLFFAVLMLGWVEVRYTRVLPWVMGAIAIGCSGAYAWHRLS